MYQAPVAYKARKAVSIQGVAYAKGQLVPADVVRKLKVGPLLSRGVLIALPDPHARKGYDGPDWMVTYVPSKAYPIATADKTTGTLTATINARVVTFSTDFTGPMFYDFGDGATATSQTGSIVHTYPSAATYAASAESATHKATKSVVIAAVAAAESQSPEPPSPAGSGDYSGYPETGTIADVKAWVGTDKERANYALDHEEAKSNPRVTLVDYLLTITEE